MGWSLSPDYPTVGSREAWPPVTIQLINGRVLLHFITPSARARVLEQAHELAGPWSTLAPATAKIHLIPDPLVMSASSQSTRYLP